MIAFGDGRGRLPLTLLLFALVVLCVVLMAADWQWSLLAVVPSLAFMAWLCIGTFYDVWRCRRG